MKLVTWQRSRKKAFSSVLTSSLPTNATVPTEHSYVTLSSNCGGLLIVRVIYLHFDSLTLGQDSAAKIGLLLLATEIWLVHNHGEEGKETTIGSNFCWCCQDLPCPVHSASHLPRCSPISPHHHHAGLTETQHIAVHTACHGMAIFNTGNCSAVLTVGLDWAARNTDSFCGNHC